MGRDSRRATVVLGTKNDEYERGLARAEKATQTWGNRVKGHISKSLRGAFGGLGGVMGLAGIAGFGALARDVKVFNDRLVRLQISANKSRGEMLAFNRALQQTASTTGASQDEILAGAQKYTELTGKFDEFAASMDTFAKAQVATGASMESLVGTAAALSSNLKVDPTQMLAALDAITSQGKSGKIEIRDMAAELPGLTGQFSQFGTTGAKGVIELGAAMQVMARGFGSASETATGMQSLMTAMVKNSGRLEGIGVKVFTKGPGGVRQLRDFADIMFELISKSKGDPKVIQHVLGRQEALQALIPVMQAGRAEFDRFIGLGEKGGVIMDDFGIASESAGGKMAKAKAHFMAVFNDALMKNLDAIVSAFEALVKALSWMASHPEALAGLALLWKGGGFMGAIGALGVGGGGPGGGGAGGGGGGAARFLGGAGGAMQGAAVGYALAQLGQGISKTEDQLDGLSTAGTTAAGALASMPGPLGLLGAAIVGMKLAADFFIAGIDKREGDRAKRTLDEFFLDRGKGLGIGNNGDELFKTNGQILQGAHGETVRSNAQSILQEGLTQGFIKPGVGGGLEMDKMAMNAFVQSQPGWDDERKNRATALFGRAFELQQIDPQLRDFTLGGAYGTRGMAKFGAGGLTPGFQGGSWQEQMALSAFDQRAGQGGASPFVFGSQPWQGGMSDSNSPGFYAQPGQGEIRITITPLEGYDVTAKKKSRKKGR